jgi:hypothetical protein
MWTLRCLISQSRIDDRFQSLVALRQHRKRKRFADLEVDVVPV